MGRRRRKKVEKIDKKQIFNKSKVEDSKVKPDLVSIHKCNNEFCGSLFYLSREAQSNDQECPYCGSVDTCFSHVGRAPQIESSRSPEKFATFLMRERAKIGLICCICGDRIKIEENQLDLELFCKRCNVKKDTFRLE